MVTPADITTRPLASSIEATASFINATLTSVVQGQNPDEKKDPLAAIEKLEIDPDVVIELAPLFERVEFKLVPDEFLDKVGDKHKVMVAKNGGSSLYIISLNKCVLEVCTKPARAAFCSLTYFFGENSRIHIISRDLEAFDSDFNPYMEDWKETKNVEVFFIPWSWIARLLAENDGDKKFKKFENIFKVKAAKTRTGTEPPTVITDNEREQILKILSDYAGHAFTLKPQDAMQKLVLAADFPDPKKFEATWKEDIEWNSLYLFNYAKGASFPSNHSRSGQSTLGWLLKALHDQAIDENSKKALVDIIVVNKLIADPDVIAKLKEKTSD